MLSDIKPDETLSSFYSRNVIFYQISASQCFAKKFRFTSTSNVWSPRMLKAFAEGLGWKGCFGFNYALHRHTTFHKSVFVTEKLGSYSKKLYRGNNFKILESNRYIRLCPVCVKEDISKFGFAYWRRSHQDEYVEVCASHNVDLVESCRVCSKPFSTKSLYVDTLWHGCECGFSVLDLEAISNYDRRKLKTAQFFTDLYLCEFQVLIADMNKVIEKRLTELELYSLIDFQDYFASIMSQSILEEFLDDIDRVKIRLRPALFSLNDFYLSTLFENFDALSRAIGESGIEKAPVREAWSTFD